MAHILAMAEHRSKLQRVLPGEVKRARSPFFNPLKAIGAARFLAEVVAGVSGRSQHHVGSSLRRDAAAHTLFDTVLCKKPAADGQPVSERASSLVEIRVGRYRLRVEIIQSLILLRMRSEMEAAGQGLVGRKDRIELREGVERLRGAEALGKRQGADLLLVEQVFDAFEEIQVVGDDGAAEIESGSRVAACRPRCPLRMKKSGNGSFRL